MGLEKILNAESVAVVGASKNETKRGFQAIRTLLDERYEGRFYPVNPREKRILGLKCYPRVSEIKEPVDIALITTPAARIPDVLADCGRKGVSGTVIIAGGFRETGKEGQRLEDEVLAVAREHHIRLIGPNTSGMMNLKTNLNLVGLRDVPRGNIALISQSGNMALALITEAKLKSNKGFSYYVGVGNEADIRFHEYLAFFCKDPGTRAILMYVEGMHEGRKFLQEAYKTTLKKPIILLKSGRSLTGKQSAGSQTGALAGMSEVARTAFQRAGIVVIENPDELFPVAETLASLPPMRNNSVAILADGGGHATIAADLLSDMGIRIPELSEATQARLARILPQAAAIRNPVDVAGATDADPTVFADCARILLNEAQVGGLLIVGLFGGYNIRFAESLALKEEDAAHQMGKLVQRRRKPIIVHSLYSSIKPHSHQLLRYYDIPVYDSLDVACRCTCALSEYGEYLKGYHAQTNFVLDWCAKAKPAGLQLIDRARSEHRRNLLELEAKQLLEVHEALACHDRLACSADEAVQIARDMGAPVALKIVSRDILHKSDLKGVQLRLHNEAEIRSAFDAIVQNTRTALPDADIRGVLVSPMAQEGLEVIIGTKIDDQFGPIIMYGLGGVLVEILQDVAYRVLPISPRSARKLIEEIKASSLLDGFRGLPPFDRKALQRLLTKCSEIMEAYPAIQEMDLNPVVVHDKGLSVVDARIILTEEIS